MLHYRNTQILSIRLRERKLGKLGVCSSQGLRPEAIYLDSWQALKLLHVPARKKEKEVGNGPSTYGTSATPEAGTL